VSLDEPDPPLEPDAQLEEAEVPLEGSPPRRPLEEGRGRHRPASIRRGRKGVPG
jgi:hypothetical protein